MQIRIGWTCRECEEEQELVTDTSNYAVLVHPGAKEVALPVASGEVVLPVEGGQGISVPGIEPVQLECRSCAHVSGELGLVYGFNREIHAPSWER